MVVNITKNLSKDEKQKLVEYRKKYRMKKMPSYNYKKKYNFF